MHDSAETMIAFQLEIRSHGWILRTIDTISGSSKIDVILYYRPRSISSPIWSQAEIPEILQD